jgi:hypothetical protein
MNMVAHASRTRTADAKPLNANVALRLTSSDQRRGGGLDRGRGWSDPRTVVEHEPTVIRPWRCGSPPWIDERWRKGMNSRRWRWALGGDEGPSRVGGVHVAHESVAREEVLPSPNRSRRTTIGSTNVDGGGWTATTVSVEFLATQGMFWWHGNRWRSKWSGNPRWVWGWGFK